MATAFTCKLCNKAFKTRMALGAHNRFTKVHGAKGKTNMGKAIMKARRERQQSISGWLTPTTGTTHTGSTHIAVGIDRPHPHYKMLATLKHDLENERIALSTQIDAVDLALKTFTL
jgi:hypothetical protein